MELSKILDRIVVPRPNGSDALDRIAELIAASLRSHGADVVLDPFPATPWGFQLVWAAAFLLIVGHAVAIVRRRDGLALTLALAVAALLFAEFELLWSPVSGLLTHEQVTVIGTCPGRPGGPTLILSAHYDTTTHFGDHLVWYRWARWLAPATAGAVLVPLAGLWRRLRARRIPAAARWIAALAVPVPYAAMAFFFAVGPFVRLPSPGALDNGGSVAALLRLAERLGARPAGAPTTVTLAFLAAEEERALGSWHFATSVATRTDAGALAVVNLEGIGADARLAYVPEDGFALRRWESPAALARLLDHVARDRAGIAVEAQPLPPGTLTDGRSFLAHGLPAITVHGLTPGGFPRRLHSAADARARLSLPAIEKAVAVLAGLIAHVDLHPDALSNL